MGLGVMRSGASYSKVRGAGIWMRIEEVYNGAGGEIDVKRECRCGCMKGAAAAGVVGAPGKDESVMMCLWKSASSCS
jgi:hypothetical protein